MIRTVVNSEDFLKSLLYAGDFVRQLNAETHSQYWELDFLT